MLHRQEGASGGDAAMKFLFTRPSPIAEALQAEGHVVVIKPVDAFPPDEGEVLGEDYPLSVLLRQVNPDVLVVLGLGHVWYSKRVVIKWSRINSKTVVGVTNLKGLQDRRRGRKSGCNVMAHNCSIFASGDLAAATAAAGAPVRSVHWTGSTTPLLAAIKHYQGRTPYNRKSPRPWR